MNVIWPSVAAVCLLWATDAAAQWRGPFPVYGYPARYCCDSGARLQVKPHETEVFVDGYFAGVVDDFDGTFQRLYVPPGEREVTLYLNGYRTFRQKVLFTPGRTLKIQHTMEKLGAGETTEPRPQARPGAQPVMPGSGDLVGPGGRRSGAFGTLSMRIQPADAEILIDGDPWQNPEGQDRIRLELVAGVHRVEIRKDGYTPYTTTVRVRIGDTVTLNVRLPKS